MTDRPVTDRRRGERPDALALLNEARRSLAEDLLPALGGEQRYLALMIGNALGIAARELESGAGAWSALERALRALLDAPETDGAALARRLTTEIRAGRWDGRPELHAVLLNHAGARLAVTNPKALAED